MWNRKENAAIANAMANAGNPGVNFMGGLNTMPEGYNDNGWQQAFHKGGTPMTQFNIGTADLVPQDQQQAMPSAWDIRQAVANTLGNPRFSMVNRENLEKLMNPYYQNAEQMRYEALRRQAAEDFGKAENPLMSAWQGIINGTIPQSVLSSVQQQNQFDTTFNNLSAAQKEQARQYNTGIDWQRYMFENPSAAQKLQDKQYYAGLKQNDDHFNKELIDRQKARDYDNYWKGKNFEAGREDAANNYNIQSRKFHAF